MKTILLAAAALTCVAATAAPAFADAGDWQVRLRAVGVVPDASGTVKVGGTALPGSLSITDSVIPEADLTYFITKNIAVEAIAGVTQHSVHQTTAGDIGSVWLLPPTVTVQYHFQPDDPMFRPYVGAGVNYTFFFSPRSPLAGIHYSDNAGFALQAGVDVPIGDKGYFFNVDVKKIFLSTDVKALGGVVTANGVNIDPWLIGVGAGLRF